MALLTCAISPGCVSVPRGEAACPRSSASSRPSAFLLPAVQFQEKAILGLPLALRKIATPARAVSIRGTTRGIRITAETTEAVGMVEINKLGIRIERNPSEERLKTLGVRSWPKWGCPASEFPWTYSDREQCYLLKGKVKVTPDGASDSVEFGAGDFVTFPEGMTCTWTVAEAVDKHYKFG